MKRWVLGVCALAACGVDPELRARDVALAVEPAVVTLGAVVAAGAPVEAEVRVTNRGRDAGAVLGVHALDTGAALELGFEVTRVRAVGGAPAIVRVSARGLTPGTHASRWAIETDPPGTLTFDVVAEVLAAPDCDDADPCTADAWAAGACAHVVTPGVPCDDGDACTLVDLCDASGACGGHTPPDCDDGIACTDDVCRPGSGCAHVGDDTRCLDADPCTLDVCEETAGCAHPTAPDYTSCGVVSCEEVHLCLLGACLAWAGVDGFPCEDGDPCTRGDSCAGGACVAGPSSPLGDPIALPAPDGGEVQLVAAGPGPEGLTLLWRAGEAFVVADFDRDGNRVLERTLSVYAGDSMARATGAIAGGTIALVRASEPSCSCDWSCPCGAGATVELFDHSGAALAGPFDLALEESAPYLLTAPVAAAARDGVIVLAVWSRGFGFYEPELPVENEGDLLVYWFLPDSAEPVVHTEVLAYTPEPEVFEPLGVVVTLDAAGTAWIELHSALGETEQRVRVFADTADGEPVAYLPVRVGERTGSVVTSLAVPALQPIDAGFLHVEGLRRTCNDCRPVVQAWPWLIADGTLEAAGWTTVHSPEDMAGDALLGLSFAAVSFDDALYVLELLQLDLAPRAYLSLLNHDASAATQIDWVELPVGGAHDPVHAMPAFVVPVGPGEAAVITTVRAQGELRDQAVLLPVGCGVLSGGDEP